MTDIIENDDEMELHAKVAIHLAESPRAHLSAIPPRLTRYVHAAWSITPEHGGPEPGYQAMRSTKEKEESRFDPLSRESLAELAGHRAS
ncbi:hypothetical protein [Streptomyces sp. NPDC003717]|uniref:hypothetical protein n=1 Tax=Streptomyces sp. NPDC003717 TaxID=3154276 RepID=UPI0033BDBD08